MGPTLWTSTSNATAMLVYRYCKIGSRVVYYLSSHVVFPQDDVKDPTPGIHKLLWLPRKLSDPGFVSTQSAFQRRSVVRGTLVAFAGPSSPEGMAAYDIHYHKMAHKSRPFAATAFASLRKNKRYCFFDVA